MGYLAGLLSAVSLLPQVSKTIREKRTRDISLGMYLIFSTAMALWLVYGVLISSWPMMISNSFTLALALTVVVLKIKHG